MVLLGFGAPFSGGGGGGGIAIRTGDGVVVLSPISGILNGSQNVDRCSAGALGALPRIWGVACKTGVAAVAARSSSGAGGNHTVSLFAMFTSLRTVGDRCKPEIDGWIDGSVPLTVGPGGRHQRNQDS